VNPWADTIAVSLVMTGFLLLGSSRISACIRFVALQGLLLALLTVAAPDATLSWATALLVLTTAAVKGFLLPWLLLRALRDVDVRREVDPLISYNLSIVAGALILGVSLWLSGRLPLPGQPPAFLLVPSAIFTALPVCFFWLAGALRLHR
jgi:hydrogenase-4 component E